MKTFIKLIHSILKKFDLNTKGKVFKFEFKILFLNSLIFIIIENFEINLFIFRFKIE